MASSLFVLLDDIATILDDVSLMTKVAAKKTAGVLGDDLALNAEQVSGVRADRELPVVWSVAKGSVRNKLILVTSHILSDLDEITSDVMHLIEGKLQFFRPISGTSPLYLLTLNGSYQRGFV